MNFELPLPKGFREAGDGLILSGIMKNSNWSRSRGVVMEGREKELYHDQNQSRYVSQGNSGKRVFRPSYFSLESMLLLLCLTASLLILPLILPPLPPPPFMLLLLPIGILAVLMILAFMPSNVRDITYSYV